MSNTTQKRIESLRRKNADKRWVNRDLYRLLYKEDLYIAAYERIKSKPGNMTKGTDGKTLDGFSLKQINKIINQMKAETFQFKPSRRAYIDKANGKKRPLGIPSPGDKIVQEVILIILESIYDSPYGSYFLESSHGFRPGRSTHTALEHIRTNWAGIKWIIEGDIESYFDSIDQHILISILLKKIDDERFINLLWKAMRAGYMEFTPCTSFKKSIVGTPQGSIISPILANIYLHELDEKLLEIIERENKGIRRKGNPEYSRLKGRIETARRKGDRDKVKELEKLISKIPRVDPFDPDFIRVKYVRYADDWIIGITGPKSLAVKIKEEIKVFLKRTLRLNLSEAKTKITHANTDAALFLGVLISTSKPTESLTKQGKGIRRRFSTGRIKMKVPTGKIIKRLALDNFCDHKGYPLSRSEWINRDDEANIKSFSNINRGIQNYYRSANNFVSLSRIQYILQFSLAKTLAQKYSTEMWKIFKKYGKRLRKKLHNGKEVEFFLCNNWSTMPMAFNTYQEGTDTSLDIEMLVFQSKLGCFCSICSSKDNIEMHHVKYIRKAGQKNSGFTRIMRLLNRKQIPVCKQCHKKIHKGDFNDILLSELSPSLIDSKPL